jgi:hypothetical protein
MAVAASAVTAGLQISGASATSTAPVQPLASNVLPTTPSLSPSEIQQVAEKGLPASEARRIQAVAATYSANFSDGVR